MAVWPIKSFEGGIADSKEAGIANSAAYLQGLNIHKNARVLEVNQALKKDSALVVTDLVIKLVSAGTKIYGFGDSGKIYKKSGGSWSVVYTDPNGEILDAYYFYNYLYWTTANNKLRRVIETSADWNTDAGDVGTLNSAERQPITAIGDQMFVGNGRYVAVVDSAGTFVSDSLDLFFGWEIRALIVEKPQLLIGAKKNDTAMLFRWDFINAAPSYDPVGNWREKDIDAFFETSEGAILIFAPSQLYWFNGILPAKLKKLPSSVRAGAIDIFNALIHFGTTKGVYSWGTQNKNYPQVLNFEYPISTGKVSNIDVGSVLATGNDLYAGWKDGSSYGIDIIDPNNKQAQGIYESLLFEGNGHFQSHNIQLFFKKLPTGTSIQPKFKIDENDTWQTIKDAQGNVLKADTLNSKQMSFPFNERFESLEIRFELNTSGNSTPSLRKAVVNISPVDSIP